MRFDKVDFFDELPGPADILGNKSPIPVKIGTYYGTISPWNTEELALMDRDITMTQRKFLTDAPLSVINTSKFVEVAGVKYSFLPVKKSSARWRVCHVREYKT